MFIRPTMTQKIIGGYFLDVKANGGCPLKIRTDYRTENRHDSSKAVPLLWIFVLQVSVMLSCASVFLWLVVTCWERADLLALVCDV